MAPPPPPPHVLVFPWPLQGHINSMLHFAAGLVGAGLHVTFLHTEHNLARVDLATAAATPRLRFVSVPDGLPAGHPRSVRDLKEPLITTVPAAYRALLASLQQPSTTADGFPPVSCIVADGLLPFAIDIAEEEEFGIPALAFRTVSACSILAYLSVPKLVDLGEAIPIPVDADLDELVRGVPGMEGFLRRRDLPSPCRVNPDTHEADPLLDMIVDFTAHSRDKARALILNTAASLEATSLAHIAEQVRGDVFAIGPLHLHAAAAAAMSSSSSSPAPATGSMWHEDGGCIAWLDAQGDRSVVYVSLGSLTVISLEQFTEFLSGLVGAGYAFLWVLRPDMVTATQNALLREAVDAAAALQGSKAAAAFVVDWAPQRAVLRHRAVGCFLTHAGWNSTVECAAEGVPTVCWPFFADQQINSRFVAAVWGTGLDMKDVCDRAVVEAMVREAMESAGIRRSAEALAEQVRRDVAEGGSSALEFDRLVGFIKELATTTKGSVDNQ